MSNSPDSVPVSARDAFKAEKAAEQKKIVDVDEESSSDKHEFVASKEAQDNVRLYLDIMNVRGDDKKAKKSFI